MDDEKEREIYAHQHKDRTDLNTQHAVAWGKYLERKGEYEQKYGTAYADTLLKKDEEALVAQFNQDHDDLYLRHDEQWLAYFGGDSPTITEQIHERDDRQGPNNSEPVSARQADHPEREPLFINPFKQIDNQKKDLSQSIKDIDQSQELMNAMRSGKKDADKKEREPVADKTPISMSARFLQSLRFTQVTEKDGKLPEQEKDIDRE